ncbi:translation initiation factor SUI1 [Ceratobasidium sp. AG-Ba]|nr:translation initiation factor SUI1 [Ceratobasidium sp. AG-Ba]
MFKKPPHKLFTSSALRNSDVKALRQRAVSLFPNAEPVTDELVPKGIMSCKFDTHLDETGTLYMSAEKEPLWFAMGRRALSQSSLVPTVYTLWKCPNLLPTISTPSAVIPILVGGADLMIPGVVPSPIIPTLAEGQLVAIAQYRSTTPLVVGSMALAGSQLKDDTDQKGKAVITLHAAGDTLWAMGSKQEPPEGKVETSVRDGEVDEMVDEVAKLDVGESGDGASVTEETTISRGRLPTAQEVETTLRGTTLYALSKLDPSSLPMPASTLYSSHILPSRPARPVLPESPSASDAADSGPLDPKVFLAHLDIKHTPQKKLAPFLKMIEKDGIIKLKDVRGELLVFSVDAEHPALVEAKKWGWKTIGAEEKEKEKEGENGSGSKEILVEEVWFPEAGSEAFFEACESSEKHYPVSALRPLLNGYITSHNLQHPANPKYVVLDDVLSRALRKKGEEPKEFVGRDELVERLTGNMKGMWRVGGSGPFKKLPLPPIVVQTKNRQGRKVVTLMTGIEPFGLDPESIAEELKKRCASSTSGKLGPCPDKPKNLEVMVQGSQVKAVVSLLLELGVPKKWISVVEKSGKGKGGK